MKTSKKDSALVFVGQIMTAYKAAMRVEGEALKAAMECGKYLNLAKENVKADRGKWLPWLKANCPEISQQTASLYMRLADPENLDKLVGVKTIRDADKALRQSGGDGDGDSNDDAGGDDNDDNADDETNNTLLKKSGASPDLTDLLKAAVDVDEIGKALKDADKLDEFETSLITRMTPEKVCDALTNAWNEDQIKDLRTRLGAYLGSLTSTTQDTSGAPVGRSQPMSGFERRM
jgi:hypothetical protein